MPPGVVGRCRDPFLRGRGRAPHRGGAWRDRGRARDPGGVRRAHPGRRGRAPDLPRAPERTGTRISGRSWSRPSTTRASTCGPHGSPPQRAPRRASARGSAWRGRPRRTCGPSGSTRARREATDRIYETGAAQELVLFVFLISLSASSMLIETRRLGVSRRMKASPTPVRTILLGEALGRYAIALVQALPIVLGTVALFRVQWGNLLTTGLVVLLFALTATGAAMLMGSVLHNAEQAGSMGVFLGLILAALGGCMVPLDVFPPLMFRIAHLIPHAWAIEALNDSIATDASPAQVSTELAVLAVYAAGLLVVATVLLRRSLTTRS
ncbi:MAG: ABC transporter permease [Actinomycetota bacterium]